jgi:AraC-like DNA-binding protein
MKPPLQKSPISPDHTFEIRHLAAPHFDPNWHFHTEFQLFIVLKGTGTRFVGDHVAPFKSGDMVFTGPNLPHLWQSDAEYFNSDSDLHTEGIVLYFQENFFGDLFLQKREMFRLRQFFTKSERGMEITGRCNEEIKHLMLQLLNAIDFDSILILMNILNVLSNTSSYKILSSAGYTNSLRESDTERMNRVHGYVMKNFREKITLQEVADVANMTPQSFSRYFKTHANKTFSDFVTEIRIGYACKLLIEKKINIGQVCYDSGFSTLSNFNRQFKTVTTYSPFSYRKKYATSLYS